jgi:transcriptional regulator with XRE-family HTH domain
VGYKIKEIRESRDMTQEELAEKSGVSRVTISGLENGTERNTTSKTLVKIAAALGVTVDQIFFTQAV